MVNSGNPTNEEKMRRVGARLGEREGSSGLSFALNAIIALFCVLLVAEVVFNSFFMGIYVVNVSMQPGLNGAESTAVSGGDFVYVNKTAQPDYGDVVVAYREVSHADGSRERGNIIKRAVAFGGDTVEIVMGTLIVNGEIVDEPYVDPNRNDPVINNYSKHTVAENSMFLLGDNRNMSTDSRDYGDYPLSALVGVVPQWSIDGKAFTTAVYTFFNFTLLGK